MIKRNKSKITTLTDITQQENIKTHEAAKDMEWQRRNRQIVDMSWRLQHSSFHN